MTGEFAVAVHALVYLNHKNRTISSEELADNVCTNAARIRKVMVKLKKAGIIYTKEGLEGGYHIARNPDEISLRQISEAVGTEFVGTGWRSGNEDMDCLIASGMAKIMDEIYENLDETCKVRLENIFISDIDQRIFGN